jgi:hypothetical protein
VSSRTTRYCHATGSKAVQIRKRLGCQSRPSTTESSDNMVCPKPLPLAVPFLPMFSNHNFRRFIHIMSDVLYPWDPALHMGRSISESQPVSKSCWTSRRRNVPNICLNIFRCVVLGNAFMRHGACTVVIQGTRTHNCVKQTEVLLQRMSFVCKLALMQRIRCSSPGHYVMKFFVLALNQRQTTTQIHSSPGPSETGLSFHWCVFAFVQGLNREQAQITELLHQDGVAIDVDKLPGDLYYRQPC